MNLELIKLLQRIKNSSDGKDFINYLIQLSVANYDSWKHEGGDVLRGKALAFDQLIALFDTIEEKGKEVKAPEEWM